MKVEYSSNNSGGSFWLSAQNWKDLETAGWDVEWRGKPFLGQDAMAASRTGLSLGDAIREWESVTGEDSSELGCSCCGVPHSFTAYDDEGEHVDSYRPEYPYTGSRYEETTR